MAASRICKIEGCGKSGRIVRGFCSSHYQRFLRHGDPLGGRIPNGEQWQYLLDHMWDECPKWPYHHGEFGYARVYDPSAGHTRFAHQVVCEMVHGLRPSPAHEVAHNCGLGHEACFGANCVEWKTREANQADRLTHGTDNRGEKHGQSKLTEQQVREIRGLKDTCGWRSLAKRYGVSRETIRDIQRQKLWGWLD